jgi:hypothetical protein
VLVCASVFAAVDASPVSAESASLSVTVEQSLSLVGRPIKVTVIGQVSQSLVGSRLVVSLVGPVSPAQVGQSKVDAVSAAQITLSLGMSPAVSGPGFNTTTTIGSSGECHHPGRVYLGSRCLPRVGRSSVWGESAGKRAHLARQSRRACGPPRRVPSVACFLGHT